MGKTRISNIHRPFTHGFKHLFIGLLLVGIYTNGNANSTVQYQIEYHKDSPIKHISLTNVEVLIQLHRNGNSIGRVTTNTDDKKNFSFKNVYGENLTVHILSLNQDNKRTRCRGVSKSNSNIIEIKCYP